ncbi:hypothetical protein EHN06_09755 [Marinobacter sp. NP-4(2019)]|nr:hypothetical protein EHN06_09755 [Marinobacter sp. NP-4(2019)]
MVKGRLSGTVGPGHASGWWHYDIRCRPDTGEAATLLVGDPTLWGILALQSVVIAIGYRGFFQLQKRSSPTFLSQLGFVITPAGLLFGILFFNESFGWAVWGGVALLMVGVVMANRPV